MLEPDMALEAALGIDSIKRVEIFSALQERVPGLPEFDTAKIGALRKIGDVLEFLEGPQEAAPGAVASSNVPRYAVVTRVAEPLGHVMLDASDGPIAVTDEGTGVAPTLVSLLRGRGYNASVCDVPSADAAAVICLAGLKPLNSIDAAI